MTSIMTTFGSGVACCGVLFFLICAGLVFWYLIRQKPMIASQSAPQPPIQATIEHPTAATTSVPPTTPTSSEPPSEPGAPNSDV